MAQGVQHPDAAGRHVQADAVGEPAVARRVVGEHDGDVALVGRRQAQPRPGRGQFRQMGDTVAHRPVAGEDGLGGRIALAGMLERDGHGSDAAVDLRQGHVHGEIARAQAARAVPPDGLGAAGQNRLEDRRVGAGERILT